MSSTATATVIGSFSTTPALNRTAKPTFCANFTSRTFLATPLSSNHFFSSLPRTSSNRSPNSRHLKRFSTVMQWQDCTVKKEVDVPVSVAYACYSDREAIAEWMPFISTVKLTVSYEVPQLLSPVASALQPFLESLLQRGLERFANLAKSYK
ncbi:hypothetical protein RYX36_019871 [Vicia faba]